MAGVGRKPGTKVQTAKPFSEALNIAIRRAVESGKHKGRKRLDVIAEKLAIDAMNGNMAAIKEVADRLDGRPAQQIHTVDDDGNPAPTGIAIVFVDREPGDASGG